MLKSENCAIFTSLCAAKSQDVAIAKNSSQNSPELAGSACFIVDGSTGSGDPLRHNPRQARNRDRVRWQENHLFARRAFARCEDSRKSDQVGAEISFHVQAAW